MMTSQILKSVDFQTTQKSRYRENEAFFLQIKELHIKGYFMTKNSFAAEVISKNKSFLLFQAPINCCVIVLWKFLALVMSPLSKWSVNSTALLPCKTSALS